LAQAFSNRAPRGRKHDFKDAERLVRRLIADELILSFVPNGEQRIWRNLTRMKTQLTRDRVRLQNQMECLLEEMRIKLSSVVSDLLGASGLRILRALAAGETEAKRLVALGDERLKCTEEQLVGQPSCSAFSLLLRFTRLFLLLGLFEDLEKDPFENKLRQRWLEHH
jgi:transposase